MCWCAVEHLHVHTHSGTPGPIFTKFFVQIPCGRSSVFLWRRCDTIYTSGFVDDVSFGHNGPYGVACRACERSGIGAENGAERAKNWVSGSGAVSGCAKKTMERERSEERTKLAAQISLKGDMLLKLRNALQTLFSPCQTINYQPEF